MFLDRSSSRRVRGSARFGELKRETKTNQPPKGKVAAIEAGEELDSSDEKAGEVVKGGGTPLLSLSSPSTQRGGDGALTARSKIQFSFLSLLLLLADGYENDELRTFSKTLRKREQKRL
jgi:hypothetical protein